MSRHTPGPWKIGWGVGCSGPRTGFTVWLDGHAEYKVVRGPYHDAPFVDGPSQVVAVVAANGDCDADLALIAAAPDLLEALEQIIGSLPQRRDWLDPAIEAAAKDALAKAEPKS